MSTLDMEREFVVSVKGETTGQDYKGKFKAKRFLSHKDRLNQDRMRRELLGGTLVDQASELAASTAEVIAQCRVRLLDAPMWWKSSDSGLDLIDQSPVVEVYNKVIEIEKEAIAALQKEGEEAKEALNKIEEPVGE